MKARVYNGTGAALAMVSLQLGLVLDSGDLLHQWRH
jgi:hypothetical protein